MGCFSVPHERKAKCRPPPSFSHNAKPHSLAAEMKQGSYCPSPASSLSGSRRDFDLGPTTISRPSPLHSTSFKLTPSRTPAGASPLGRHHNSHRGHRYLFEDGTVGRCSSCGYVDERSSTTCISVEKEDEEGHLFPLPLPPASVSVSSTTSLNTCTDDASSHSVSSTGSASSPSASVPGTSASASSPSVNSRGCNYPLNLSSTADSHPVQRWHSSPLPLPPPPDSGAKLCEYSYEELAGACLNFAREFFIREGGAGPVFRALLKRAREGGSIDLAITRLTQGRSHSLKRWRFEVGSLSRLSHPHLCKVIGFSAEDPSMPPDKLPGFERERLLVYEHTANGSLESLLYSRKGRAPLDWGMRLKIAMGAAQGLAYLHDRIPRQIIYKSFKTINIQVDATFNAKLSDYGFARSCGEQPVMLSPAPSTSVNDVYAAPETRMSEEVSAKSNVWSFGIVLLELLTGRQNMDEFFPSEERNLLQWCRPYLLDSKRLYLIMDPELKGRYPTRMAKTLADLALQCLVEDPIVRPSMREVAASLCDLVGDGKVDSASSATIVSNHARSVNLMNNIHSSNRIVRCPDGYKASIDGISAYSSNYGSKFKLSKSYSLVSVLASPARVFVGSGAGANENGYVHGHSQRARVRGFLSGEISKEACRSWARDHPGLLRSYGFLSGEGGVQEKGSGRLSSLSPSPFSQDSYLPPPLGRSISSSSPITSTY